MKNPINKRINRMLISNSTKNILIFSLILLTVIIFSAFYINQGSLEELYYENLKESKVEDGQFTVAYRVGDDVLQELEKENVKIYENFYIEEKIDTDRTLRVFKNRENINTAMYSLGKMPKREDEIAIVNVMAKANGYKIGDELI